MLNELQQQHHGQQQLQFKKNPIHIPPTYRHMNFTKHFCSFTGVQKGNVLRRCHNYSTCKNVPLSFEKSISISFGRNITQVIHMVVMIMMMVVVMMIVGGGDGASDGGAR